MLKVVSVVISAYNEEGNIEELYNQLTKYLTAITAIDYELIFVNDGSKDATLLKCISLAQTDNKVKIVNLTRNFGHEIAMTAGMDYSKGGAVVFMDADLQHPPHKMAEMINIWLEKDLDIILTKRINVDRSIKRKLANWVFYKMYNLLSDVELDGEMPDFRLVSRKYIDRIKLIVQKERMFKGLINFVGYSKSQIIEFEVPERFSGVTKYNFFSLVSLAINGILQFSTRPLRIITYFGIIFAFLSFFILCFTIFEHYYYNLPNSGFTTIVVLLTGYFAFQTMFISILGEYIARIHMEVKNRPLYFADYIDYEKIKSN